MSTQSLSRHHWLKLQLTMWTSRRLPQSLQCNSCSQEVPSSLTCHSTVLSWSNAYFLTALSVTRLILESITALAWSIMLLLQLALTTRRRLRSGTLRHIPTIRMEETFTSASWDWITMSLRCKSLHLSQTQLSIMELTTIAQPSFPMILLWSCTSLFLLSSCTLMRLKHRS